MKSSTKNANNMKNLTGVGIVILKSGLRQLKQRKLKMARSHNEHENFVAALEIEEVEWAIKQMQRAYSTGGTKP